MKIAVIYSSKTGNTRKVAEAIHSALPEGTPLLSADNTERLDLFDLIFMGYWVDKGTADNTAQKTMARISGTRTALFATLGAEPDSQHARNSLENGARLLGENCKVHATFICQGAIDPKLQESMRSLPEDHPHAVTPERLERWERAASHPDENDLCQAAAFARGTVLSVEKEMAETQKKINEILRENPGTLPASIAKELRVTEREVYSFMPNDMALHMPITRFEELWDKMSQWESVIFVANTYGMVIEVKGKLSPGNNAHGYFNLHSPDSPLHGHIKTDNLSAIYLVSKPFMGMESHSVQFIDNKGTAAFGIYVGRDKNHKLLPDVLAGFMKLKETFSQE